MGDNTFKAPDVENDRRQLLGEMDAEFGPDWSQLNAPGSFGCHELLDRANLIGDLVEESLLNHPACIGNPAWFALASQAVVSLRELYQRIGQDHAEPPQVMNHREADVSPQGKPESQSERAGTR